MCARRTRTLCPSSLTWMAGLDRRVSEGDRAAHHPPSSAANAVEAFHVVGPSLPGFGFSGRPTTTGGSRTHWCRVRRAHGAPRLLAVCGAGRGLGLRDQSVVGATDAEHCAMIELTLAMSARPTGEPSRPPSSTPSSGSSTTCSGIWVLHTAATRPQTSVRAHRFARRAARVDPGEVLGVDGLDGHPENVIGRDSGDAHT